LLEQITLAVATVRTQTFWQDINLLFNILPAEVGLKQAASLFACKIGMALLDTSWPSSSNQWLAR
jgi:hypothetical protein